VSYGGAEYVLKDGGYTAVITQVGAGIRLLRDEGRDLVLPYPVGDVRPRFRGGLVAPWPNRIADGRYTFDGREHQLSINEPERQTALHGLISWVRFAVVRQDTATVTLTHQLVPSPGYPFPIDLTVTYAVAADGLHCTVLARNTGDAPAPYGTAPHPYLYGGQGHVDDWTLQLPATEVLEVTPDRLLPLQRVPVHETDMDFREGRPLRHIEIDHAFTRLVPDSDGMVRVRVTSKASTGVECEWDPAVLPWVQVHTADLPLAEESRLGLAVEPMTCPPDAFNSGEDLVVLAPGEEHKAFWTIRAV
jgi:aldose 1-epimerase